MSDDTPDLAMLARQQQLILDNLARMREDMRSFIANLSRLDATTTALLSEVRSLNAEDRPSPMTPEQAQRLAGFYRAFATQLTEFGLGREANAAAHEAQRWSDIANLPGGAPER